MKEFTSWLDKILEKPLPKKVAAINFNLYEEEDNCWSMEFVGAGSFDEEDQDWACDEIFVTRDNRLSWEKETEWEAVHDEAVNSVRSYLKNGKHADILKEYKGVGVGFVDGDISIVYQK